MLYILLLGLISTLGFMSLKSVYIYQEGMNSDKDKVNSIKLEILYKKEIVLKEAINEYIEDRGEIPVDIIELKNEGYIGQGYDMSNIFNDNYIEYGIVDNKIEIKQRISESEIRSKYINHIYNKRNKELGDEYRSYESGEDVIHKYKIRESGLNNLKKDMISESTKSVLEKSEFLNCKEIKEYDKNMPDGVYKSKLGFDMYCDMSTDGGGWTLVWSNIKEMTGDLQESLSHLESTTILPIYNGEIGEDKSIFEVYTGLEVWNNLLNDSKGELMYEWNDGYNESKVFISKIGYLDKDDNYRLKLSEVRGDIGDLYNYHNNSLFSAKDMDKDINEGNCSVFSDQIPFWYKDCWQGSILGGDKDYLGAYWIGSDGYYASEYSNDRGAGNGWFFIR